MRPYQAILIVFIFLTTVAADCSSGGGDSGGGANCSDGSQDAYFKLGYIDGCRSGSLNDLLVASNATTYTVANVTVFNDSKVKTHLNLDLNRLNRANYYDPTCDCFKFPVPYDCAYTISIGVQQTDCKVSGSSQCNTWINSYGSTTNKPSKLNPQQIGFGSPHPKNCTL